MLTYNTPLTRLGGIVAALQVESYNRRRKEIWALKDGRVVALSLGKDGKEYEIIGEVPQAQIEAWQGGDAAEKYLKFFNPNSKF
jgi:hypothetical protein